MLNKTHKIIFFSFNNQIIAELKKLLEKNQILASSSIFDLLNTNLILSQADQLINQKNITNGTQAEIFYSNNTIKIQTANETLTNKVDSKDNSQTGIVSADVLSQIKEMV